jgi:hypothetical protein
VKSIPLNYNLHCIYLRNLYKSYKERLQNKEPSYRWLTIATDSEGPEELFHRFATFNPKAALELKQYYLDYKVSFTQFSLSLLCVD